MQHPSRRLAALPGIAGSKLTHVGRLPVLNFISARGGVELPRVSERGEQIARGTLAENTDVSDTTGPSNGRRSLFSPRRREQRGKWAVLGFRDGELIGNQTTTDVRRRERTLLLDTRDPERRLNIAVSCQRSVRCDRETDGINPFGLARSLYKESLEEAIGDAKADGPARLSAMRRLAFASQAGAQSHVAI